MGDVIVTVHGTGDSEILDERIKWWQSGSDFERDLLHYLGDEFAGFGFEPFMWSGANSERERRKAAQSLLKRLKAHEEAGDTYHLIGHSHGGSVIAEAMMTAASKRKLQLIGPQSITSVGMPLINFVRKRIAIRSIVKGMFGPRVWLLFGAFLLAVALFGASVGVLAERMPGPVQALLDVVERADLYLQKFGESVWAVLYSLSTLILRDIPALLFNQAIVDVDLYLGADPDDDSGRPFGAYMAAAAIAAVIAANIGMINTLYGALVFQRARYRPSQMGRANPNALKWQSLWHPTDEVLAGLSSAHKINVPIFRSMRLSEGLRAIWAVALFAGLASLLLGIVLSLAFSIFSGASGHGSFPVYSYSPDTGGQVMPPFPLAHALMLFGLIVAVVSPLIGPLAFGLRQLADAPIGGTIGRSLDRLVNGKLRANAYGLDVADETVWRVHLQPRFLTNEWRGLPEPIASEMVAFVDKAAMKTLSKLRALLGTAHLSSNIDVFGVIAGQLSWDELIHTAYFDNQRFVKLVAYGMLKLLGKPTSAALRADSDLPQIERWYAHVSGGTPIAAQA